MAGKVDIVVGGQFGDEGKGSVALHLAHFRNYGAYVRTGGENAEHRVITPDGQEHCFHILPTALAARRDNCPKLILAAGMTFSLAGLYREMETHSIPWDRLVIDRNAAIITDDLRKSGEEAANKRGSTFLGVGATMAAKVRRAGQCTLAQDTTLISSCSLASLCMRRILNAGENILLEGSQGTMLSLDHGYYPYCTSRNVTAMGALSDAGLNWKDVRDVFMVVKTVPTRVPGNSGPSLGREMSWELVCQHAGRPYEEIVQSADESAGDGAGGLERPFELSIPEICHAADLNGATRIVLTFADWWDYKDLGVQCWGALSYRTKALVVALEKRLGIPVVMVRTGPDYKDYVTWQGGLLA